MGKLLTDAEVDHVKDLIEELESLIDADDGTVFMIKHIDQVAVLREIIYGDESERMGVRSGDDTPEG